MNDRLVSIGLPVYNGQNFLREAIESVLAQTYGEFELIICDNASTDSTEELCRYFARQDSRIRYVRNAANVGAAPNFNGIVPLARGRYFKWLAHDDSIAPTFLAQCVDALERDPNAVLASPRVRFIDSEGKALGDYVSPFRNDDPDRPARFRERLRWGQKCFEVYGLIRLNELRRTKLLATYAHGDGVLLAHLALLGHFVDIPEYLFYLRIHEGQAMNVFDVAHGGAIIDSEGYARWFDSSNRAVVTRSFNRMLAEYLWMTTTTPLPFVERLRCYREVVQWCRSRRRILAGEWKRTLRHACGLPCQAEQGRRSSA